MTGNELLNYLFDGKTHALTASVARWLTASRRFQAFVITYRDKIRKKIRNAQDADKQNSLYAELETAYLLLQERRFTLEYEKQGTGKTRDPDFCVTFRANVVFHLEVTCMRASGRETDFSADRLIATVCNKIGQLPAGGINILAISIGCISIEPEAVTSAMQSLKERAERREEGLYARFGFDSPAHFFKYYQRLSGLLLREDGRTALWTNPQARYPVPQPIRAILQDWRRGE